MAKKKKIAIFDIDGTIFRSSLLVELVSILVHEGIFPKKAGEEYADEYHNWLNRQGSYEDYVHEIIRVFDKYIKGVKYDVFLKSVRQTMSFYQKRVYRYTRDLASDLKKRGYYLLAISHSPHETVKAFSENFGFDVVYGRFMEVDEKGRLTGKVLNEDLIVKKDKLLMYEVEAHNLTLSGSIGVGDTEADVPFLKVVDRPICFNPNKKLYDFAKKRKWNVVVERKDVIYHL